MALAESARALRDYVAQIEEMAQGNAATAEKLSATIEEVSAQAGQLRQMAEELLRSA